MFPVCVKQVITRRKTHEYKFTDLSQFSLATQGYACGCNVTGWLHAVGVSIYNWHAEIKFVTCGYIFFRPRLIPHTDNANGICRCGLPLLHNVLLLVEVASIPDCAQ